MELGPGTPLGIYRLEKPLGRGGMGQVWKATDGKRPVAIKLLPPEFRGNASAMAQVGEAFQVVHALTHEHICKTLGLFDDPVYGPYLVLDYIAGITLSEYQRTGGFSKGRVPLERVGEILRPVARALDYSHRKVIQLANGTEHEGVLHRDVKPDNILLVLRENRIREVWLIDFGLAAEIRNTMTKHTNKSVDTRGTRPYMSPEQIKGKRHQWDGRTDQYSLAVVAYQLLAGHLPFDGDDEFSLMLAITQEPADPIDGVPDHVNAAVLKGLSKTQEERFATCHELAEALVAAPEPRIVVPEPNSLLKNVARTPRPSESQLESTDEASVLRFFQHAAKIVVPSPAATAGGWLNSATQAGDRAVFTLKGNEYAFRWCPPGKFTMGSPKNEAGRSDNEDQVQVELTKGFWMQETVVTQAMWSAVMGSQPWQGEGCEQEGQHSPATYVGWKGATEFCHRLGAAAEKSGALPAGEIALPTEACWEYACRAGTSTAYSFGNDPAKLGGYAWFGENAYDIDEQYAHEVGQKKPNPWGLLDMHGNVWEWCQDGYDAKLRGGRDPIVSSGSSRVMRGGSWNLYATCTRCSRRIDIDPADRIFNTGFRVLVSL